MATSPISPFHSCLAAAHSGARQADSPKADLVGQEACACIFEPFHVPPQPLPSPPPHQALNWQPPPTLLFDLTDTHLEAAPFPSVEEGRIQKLYDDERLKKEFFARKLDEISRGAYKIIFYIQIHAPSTPPKMKALGLPIYDTQETWASLKRESRISKELRDNGIPHILKIRLIRWINSRGRSALGVLMEPCNSGSLHHFLSNSPYWPLQGKLQLALEVFEAISAMHERGVCHLDVKTSNVLLSDTEGVLHTRLSDFGCSHRVNEPIVGFCCTFPPPELVRQKLDNPNSIKASPTYDLWGLADLLFYCSAGHSLFQNDTNVLVWPSCSPALYFEALTRMYQELPHALATLPQPIRECIEGLLAEDPTKRPSARSVVERLRYFLTP